MAKHTSRIGPSQKVRCRGGKHYADPNRFDGPPRLRTGGGAWSQIELYSNLPSPKKEQDNTLERLFKMTDPNRKK